MLASMPVVDVALESARRADRQVTSRPTPPLTAVIPIYDESEILPELYRRLTATFADLGVEYELLFVNDGSQDATPTLLDAFVANDSHVTVLHLSRNFGHQAAVTAGLEYARGDAVVILDGDLQDPPEVIPQLVERWREGFDVVYAVRTKRKEGPLKRLGYFVFYRLLRAVSDLDVPLDAGDFCLMDRRAVDAVNRLPERCRFVRGLRSFVGYRQTGVVYERDARRAGRAKYTFGRLVALALDGVVSFSSFPVRLVGWAAGFTAIAGAIVGAGAAFGWASSGNPPAGWLVVLIAVLGLSAMQFACLTGLGLYLLKIATEVKRRPPYIVDEVRTMTMSSRDTARR